MDRCVTVRPRDPVLRCRWGVRQYPVNDGMAQDGESGAVSGWIAVSNGVIDLQGVAQRAETHAELAITPVFASEPLAIGGDVASLWRSLAAGGVSDEDLSPDQRVLVREFAEAGIASTDERDIRRVTQIDAPWFESFLHELVCGLAVRIAESCGARCLVIKGPTLRAQHLRERAHSGDVDLLVEPGRVSEFVRAMAEWGWRYRPNPMDGTLLPHSHTLTPESWGCEIDAHFRIPGIAVSPDRSFEILWEQAEERAFAGVQGFTPNVAAHALLQALTLARPTPGGVGQSPYESAVEALRRGTDASLRLAVELRAHGALQEELRAAFPASQVSAEPVPDDWVWLAQPNPARVYLHLLRATPWGQKPAVLWKILISAGAGRSGCHGLLLRWFRGVRQLITSNRERSA